MHKQKVIPCFFLFTIISVQALAQDGINLKTIIKQINKTDKLLATELGSVKYIPGRTFIKQEFEGHDSLSFYAAEKTSTSGFYISSYEVTNKEYRQFLDYVVDSIMRRLMGYVKQDKDGNEYNDLTKKMDRQNIKKRMEQVDGILPDKHLLIKKVDGIDQYNPNYLVYARKLEKKRVTTKVLPDIDCWKKDYPYSYNEPMASNYFYHPAFDNYPVIGVNFLQAEAYCHWKTQQLKNASGIHADYEIIVSLPSTSQWEAAAIFGTEADSGVHSMQIAAQNENRRYQNKPVKVNSKNTVEFDCNFGAILDVNGYIVKSHGDDGAKFTMKADAYKPNFYGLYNMKGNIAEWTTTNGDECYNNLAKYFSGNPDKSKSFIDSIKSTNPQAVILTKPVDSFLKQMKETKIVKGGGWTSSPFYIQPGVNQFYNPSSQHGAIGFRYVVIFKRKSDG